MRRLARAEGYEGGGCSLEKGELMPAEGGGRQATKASMSQNVDRERRVPLPLIHGFVDNCTSPGVDRVAGTRGDDYRSVTVRVRSVHNFPSHW